MTARLAPSRFQILRSIASLFAPGCARSSISLSRRWREAERVTPRPEGKNMLPPPMSGRWGSLVIANGPPAWRPKHYPKWVAEPSGAGVRSGQNPDLLLLDQIEIDLGAEAGAGRGVDIALLVYL